MNQSVKKFSVNYLDRISYTYTSKMDNMLSNGEIAASHILSSEYSMRPGGKSGNDYILDALYTVDKMYYTSPLGKEIEWRFAEGSEFVSVLFNTSTKDSIKHLLRDENKSLLESQWESINVLFAKYPKLPSTGILHAFVFDIVTMDQMLSHILSSNITQDDFDDLKLLKSVSNRQLNFSVDLYSDGTDYTNGNTKACSLGQSKFKEHICNLYKFSCDDSVFKSQNKNIKKNGFSYYSGIIVIDIKTGTLYGADMREYIFSETMKKNTIMRRHVSIKATDYVNLV